jgi:hypothetical protein
MFEITNSILCTEWFWDFSGIYQGFLANRILCTEW